MLRVGLTGGIGAGKSSVARRLEGLGAVVVDADRLAREVVAPGTAGLAEVRTAFGEAVITPDGALDRAALAAVVFTDPVARGRLETITHPRIAARTAELFAAAERDRGAGVVVVHDVPLLVENSLGAAYQLVIVVDARESVRIERLLTARGMGEEEARSRIAAQASTRQRRAAADIWLDNDGPPADLTARVDALWAARLRPFAQLLAAGEPAPRPSGPPVVPPDPGWPAAAARLIARLRRCLAGRPAELHHVGPTSTGGPAPDVLHIDVRLGTAVRGKDEPDLRPAGLVPVGADDAGHTVFRSADPQRAADVVVHRPG